MVKTSRDEEKYSFEAQGRYSQAAIRRKGRKDWRDIETEVLRASREEDEIEEPLYWDDHIYSKRNRMHTLYIHQDDFWEK